MKTIQLTALVAVGALTALTPLAAASAQTTPEAAPQQAPARTAPVCRADQLSVTVELYQRIVATNIQPLNACGIYGFPTMTPSNPSVTGPPSVRTRDNADYVILGPGETATAGFTVLDPAIYDPALCRSETATTLRYTDDEFESTVAFDAEMSLPDGGLKFCTGADLPSIVVSPFRR